MTRPQLDARPAADDQVQMPNLTISASADRDSIFHPRAIALSIIAILSLALLFAAQASATVKIVAPVTAQAGEEIRFAAKPSSPTEAIAFFVDGRRRSVDTSPAWQVGSNGYVTLKPGSHTLKVRATQPGRIVTTTRKTYITPGTRGRAKIANAVATAPGSRKNLAGKSGDLLFSGSKIGDFLYNQSAPGAITEVADPSGGNEPTLKMTVADDDVAPVTPTDDPRAQLLTPAFVNPGDELWWHARFYMPKDYPADVPGWQNIIEGPYGLPYGGAPSFSISADEGDFRFQRNENYDCDIPWSAPIVRGQWVDVLTHMRFASDGWVELWIDGQQINFFESSSFNPNHEGQTTRLNYRTMDDRNDGGPNFFVIQNYRKKGMFDSTTIYHGPTEIGTTRASVGA
jgi:hypothetical protein